MFSSAQYLCNSFKSFLVDDIRNDSIIAKSCTGKYETYFFNLKKESWQQIKEADDVLYEDDDYYITSIDYGEGGYTTWFKDKNQHTI